MHVEIFPIDKFMVLNMKVDHPLVSYGVVKFIGKARGQYNGTCVGYGRRLGIGTQKAQDATDTVNDIGVDVTNFKNRKE